MEDRMVGNPGYEMRRDLKQIARHGLPGDIDSNQVIENKYVFSLDQ
jgi:hypothetical protein